MFAVWTKLYSVVSQRRSFFLSSFMEHDLDHTYICMQHWHQPKHIIYDSTESYIILLNSPYSIFYRNALRIIKVTVVKPTHMQSELTDIMRGRVLCWDGMNLLLLQCTDAAVPVLIRFHCRCLARLITLCCWRCQRWKTLSLRLKKS